MNARKNALPATEQLVLIAPVVPCVGLAIWSLCGTGSTWGIAPSSLQGDATLRLLKEQGLYDSLEEAVRAARYQLGHLVRCRLGVRAECGSVEPAGLSESLKHGET
jgi:hypothetical protein